MWAQRLVAPETFERVEVDAPDPAGLAPGQVLLATSAGGICGSDLPFFRGGTAPAGSATATGFGRAGFPLHEVTGRVLASAHPAHAVGDDVVGWASGFDGLAEQVVTDGEGLATYDPAWEPAVAILVQPLACVLYAVEQIAGVAGADVAVIGQGPIGLLFSHVLKDAGARHVTGVDRVDRAGVAAEFGVDDVVHAASDRWAAGLGADRPAIVVEAVGHQAATLGHAVTAAAAGGQIFYFGIPDDASYAFDLRTFLRKNLTLRSGATLERRRMLTTAVAYLRAHPALTKNYVTDVIPFDDAGDAFTRALHPRPAQIKIALTTA